VAELPFMPVKVTDILCDAGDLPNAQFGCYCKLLFRWWSHGALPVDDEAKLRRWAGTSAKGFETLKPFLTKTERGWIQRRLARTFAEQKEKSIKASNSAKARSGANVDQRTLNESIAKAYADRMLSMKHEAGSKVEEANASSPKEKNKYKKKKGAGVTGGAKSETPWPDDPAALSVAKALADRIGENAFASWFHDGAGGPGIVIDSAGVVCVNGSSQVRRDKIKNQFSPHLTEIAGKDNWRFVDGEAA